MPREISHEVSRLAAQRVANAAKENLSFRLEQRAEREFQTKPFAGYSIASPRLRAHACPRTGEPQCLRTYWPDIDSQVGKSCSGPFWQPNFSASSRCSRSSKVPAFTSLPQRWLTTRPLPRPLTSTR